jgi:HlyD family secretion protein
LANFGELNAQLQLQLQQLENVEVNKKRIETLLLQNAATQQQFDDITGQYKVAKKQIIATESKKNTITQQVEILKEQQKQIELNISKCTIKNPIAGSVLSKLSMKGENTTPGKPLYSIADLSFLKLKAYISGNKLSSVELGEKVKVLIDGKNGELQPIEGTIVWISESAEFTPKTIQTKEERVNLVYAIKIKVKNTGNIKIGMPAEVVFNNNK